MQKGILRFLLLFILLLGSYAIMAQGGYGNFLCHHSEKYACYEVKSGETWQSLFPDEAERDLIMRINRKNIPLRAGSILAIPQNVETVNYFELAPFPLRIPSINRRVIFVDPAKLAWGAYDERGILINWGPISAGKAWCEDSNESCYTDSGAFVFDYKSDETCESSLYPVGIGGAPMPYCMFFNKNQALHGSSQLPGYNASHGCVRLFTEDAMWLNESFIQISDPKTRTKVIIEPYQDEYLTGEER